MDKYNFNKCKICKIRGYIECNLCDNQVFFCSRGHLHTHQQKYHKDNKQILNYTDGLNCNSNNISEAKNKKIFEQEIKINFNSNDPRKVFEQLQKAKMDVELKIKENKFSEAIIDINKLLYVSAKFYEENHIFVNF